MAEHMAWAEIAVVACGVTVWELIYMGASVIGWPRNEANQKTLAILQEKQVVEALPRNPDASCIADRLVALTACIEVSRVDHLDTGGDRRLDERDVFLGLRQPVGAQADPCHIDFAEFQVVPVHDETNEGIGEIRER